MTTNRYLTRAQQRRLIATSVFYILLLYTRFTPRRNTRGWRPEKKGREAACAQAAPRVCLPSRPDGPEPEGASGQQHVDHGLQPQQIAILIGAAGLQPGQIHFVKCRSRIVLFEEHYHIDGSIDDFAGHSQIGIVEYPYDYHRLTVCDVPGLIPGAHQNKGLGHAFLRHIRRCKIIVLLIDIL